jgi:hypothetical protein
MSKSMRWVMDASEECCVNGILKHAQKNLLNALAGEEHFRVVVKAGLAGFPFNVGHVECVGRRVAWMTRSIEMVAGTQEVHIRELDKARMSMVPSTELRIDCGGISNALVVCQFDCLVIGLADDSVEGSKYESGADVVEARGSHCHVLLCLVK